mgnify:CR=1 FL=1
MELEFFGHVGVDAALVRLAREHGASLVTVDHNLAKVAEALRTLAAVHGTDVRGAVYRRVKIFNASNGKVEELEPVVKTDAEWRSALKREGFGTEGEFRKFLTDGERRAEQQRIAIDSLKAHGRFSAPVQVTEKEIDDGIAKVKDRLPKRPTSISFKQVVIAPRANAANDKSALDKAQAVLDEIKKVEVAGLTRNTKFNLRRGAGAYICGEESAMIESIEGKRGMPRLRPPYVAEVGLFGRPTLAHNVETLAWVPIILAQGAEWFASHGRRGRKGLRSFSVSGRVREPGVKIAIPSNPYDAKGLLKTAIRDDDLPLRLRGHGRTSLTSTATRSASTASGRCPCRPW